MTEQGFAARQTNEMSFHGSATSEGRERVCLAQPRCGPAPPNQPARRAQEKIMEDSSFREVRRLTSLLLKIKGYER
jgi:hypothetical protein